MDVLSDAIAAMRTGLPHSARVDHRIPFGRRFPPSEGAGFHVVLQGTAWLIPEDGEPVALGPGDMVFLPRGAAHGLADSPATPLVDAPASLARLRPDSEAGATPVTVMLCGAYLLDRSRVHPLMDEVPEVFHLPTRVGHRPELRAALDLLGGELESSRPGGDAMVPALLDVLLLHILRAWLDQHKDTPTGWTAALRDPPITAALRAMHSEPARQWSVDELARCAGLSRAAFARRFTTLVGQPPLTYLTWWRMTIAAKLLQASDVPANVVAGKVGYTSEYAFAHAFKRAYGQPPGAYRRQLADQQGQRADAGHVGVGQELRW